MTSGDVSRNDEAAAVVSLATAASGQLIKPSFPTVADSETLLSQPTAYLVAIPQQRDDAVKADYSMQRTGPQPQPGGYICR